jgi:hypothetical protein
MPGFLIASIVVSVVLTVLVNLALRAPGARRRVADQVQQMVERSERSEPDGRRSGSGVRVIFPWKAMLIASLVLTVLLNLVFLAR